MGDNSKTVYQIFHKFTTKLLEIDPIIYNVYKTSTLYRADIITTILLFSFVIYYIIVVVIIFINNHNFIMFRLDTVNGRPT